MAPRAAALAPHRAKSPHPTQPIRVLDNHAPYEGGLGAKRRNPPPCLLDGPTVGYAPLRGANPPYAARTLTRIAPIPEIVASSTSPGPIGPTPSGVPVSSTSP